MIRKKKFTALVLSCLMVLSLFSATAHAEAEHEHIYTDKVIRVASCETRGIVKHSCDCGYYYYEQMPAHPNHKEDIITEATCGANGEKNIICSDCNTILEKGIVIPATGKHTMETKTIDATCTSPEMIGEVCTVCGHSTGLEAIEGSKPLGHDYASEIIDADCLNGESIKYTCTRCGETYTESTGLVEALGHKWDDGVLTKATCTKGGYTTYTCKLCGKTEIRDNTEALGHDYKEKVVAPTCGAKGYTEMICSYCGDSYVVKGSETDIDSNAHDYIVGKVIREATCSKTGIAKMVCSICGKSGGYKMLDVQHIWGEEYANDKGTVVYHKCTVCDFEEIIFAFDDIVCNTHTIVTDEAVDATCTENGLTAGSHCSVCGTVIAEQTVVPALGHTIVTDEAVDATCTENGLTAGSHCSVCEIVIAEQTVVPALGHGDYIYKILNRIPVKVCKICGHAV